MENKDPVVMHPLNDFIPGRGGGTSRISGWGCAAGTLEPLAIE